MFEGNMKKKCLRTKFFIKGGGAMNPMNRYVVVDLETTGNSSANQDKIIEVGIVVIENDQIVDEFSTMLSPGKEIPPFITKLTGITDEDVKQAPTFQEMADTIVHLFENSYLIAHNVPFDLGFLNAELTAIGKRRLHNPVIDTVELTRILYPQAPGYKLGILAEYLAITHDNPHRALSDAYVTAKLFINLMQKLSSLPYETLSQLLKLEPMLKSDLSLLLQAMQTTSAFNENSHVVSYKGLAFRDLTSDKREKVLLSSSYGDYLDAIYEEDGAMAAEMKHYEKRDGQRDMSEIVYDAFQSRKHALIEAETGTGKSLAYLLPAVYESVHSNKRIVISTYTTQLQSQLLEEEVPLIKKLVSFPFSVSLLKGKQHYISLEKFANELFSDQQENYDVALTKAMILVWLLETETGDIDELHLPSHGQLFYKRISADTEGQLDPFSPWYKYSYYQKARRKAQQSNIIITNHALLCTDMFHDYQFLPSYEKAIIDEAHHLEETAAKHYGLKLDYVNMQHVFNQLGSYSEGKWISSLVNDKETPELEQAIPKERWDDLYALIKYELDDLFRTIFQYVLHQQGTSKTLSDVGRIQYRYQSEKEQSTKWLTIKEMASRMIYYLRDLIHLLTGLESVVTNKENLDSVQQKIEVLQSFIDGLEQLFLLDNDTTDVKWIEIEAYGAKNAVYLYSEPVSIASILSEGFFNQKESVVLTSATLTMKNSFTFIQKRLGLTPEQVVTKKIASPFSYDQQVQVLIPNDFPAVQYGDTDDFIFATCESILSLAEITNGRMLVLFTSYDMLKKSYYLLKEIMENDQFVLIAQGISSGSRARLKKNFQTFDQSILLGTSSFWEGVDIPGDDLSCLMIVRLPFQPPNHPVYEAKAIEMKKNDENAFYDLSLPNAVIRFKQGFGRLIRSTNDRGIVFVCDARIMTARYGSYFTGSIPAVPITFDSTAKLMEKAKNWF
ncbi:ATP-dependent DNA helicase DinG [Ornithinibacillus contaminans]|uniref:ATP-dependent DNA helicase DinG n=1 Tax=Ornithinibacillus contaminans TaxID=694055 RepID=UPI001EFFAFEC|nr:ATP-dependent DNA helicase DinG [Ornithinibacillus contaminans]